MTPPSPAPRGRPRKHLDDAERHRAFRERRQADLDRGEIARAILRSPNPLLVQRIAKAYLSDENCAPEAIAALRAALEHAIVEALLQHQGPSTSLSQLHRDI
jgi:hypothetical protein